MSARTAPPAVAGTPAVPVTAAGRGICASTFAGSSVCLAVAAHTAAGGHRPSAAVFLTAFGLITRIAYGLAGRERHVTAVLAGVALTQIALHATFAIMSHDTITSHGAGMAPGAVLHDGVAMTAVHSIAAGLVAGMLSRAEKGLWSTAVLRLAVVRFRMLSRSAGLLFQAARRFAAMLSLLLTIGPDGVRAAAGMPGRYSPAVSAPSASIGGRLFVRAGRRRGPPSVRTATAG